MRSRPEVVAFDIIGTTFSLAPIRDRLVALGLPPGALDLWYATGLRDAFALAASDSFAPFASVLEDAFDQVLFKHGARASAAEKAEIMETMRRLPAHPDAEEAFRILSGADLRIVALSNGARAATAALLAAAGLDAYVAQVLSVDDVQRSKPRREVYLHAARAAGVGPTALAMVATHPWDLHGAKAAGLITGFVARGQPYPSVMHPPDVTGDTLSDVARALSSARGQDADLA